MAKVIANSQGKVVVANNKALQAQDTVTISTDLVADRASDDKASSPKSVFDQLFKWGVVSQTQTWTGSISTGYTYTMSDKVYGIIPMVFVDLATSFGATFNDTTGYFELNGLTDISYEEMQNIIEANRVAAIVGNQGGQTLRVVKPSRTVNLPNGVAYVSGNLTNALRVGSFGTKTISTVEVVCVGTPNGYALNASSIEQLCYGCRYLKVLGINMSIYCTGTVTNAFVSCSSLEVVKLQGVNKSISFSDSPKLTSDSVAYLISNAGTSAITITLHATAYARAIADSDVQAALAAHTNVSLASA